MLFIFVVTAIFAALVWRNAWRYRRAARITFHPSVDELARSTAPAKLQRFLADIEPDLVQLGFHAFGNVRIIEFRAGLAGTGVFFVRKMSRDGR